MSTIAIIPARGGSKRLPRKNILDFLGKPIIAYSIAAARECSLFSRVAVSTEDEEIAEVAARYGAEIVLRPSALATDTATVKQVCLDLLSQEEASGRSHDRFACLYPTAPLRDAEDIRSVAALIEPGLCEFAMAVTTYELPFYQALIDDGRGALVPVWPGMVAAQSQQHPRVVVDNGSTYFATVAAFRQHGEFYGPGLRGFEMSPLKSTDINNALDFEMAKCRARLLWEECES